MPKPVRGAPTKHHYNEANSTRARFDYYYASKHCVLCGELVQGSHHLCEKCCEKGPVSAAAMTGITSKLESDIQHLAAPLGTSEPHEFTGVEHSPPKSAQICRDCGGGDWLVESGVKCVSLACSVYYERRKVQKELRAFSSIATSEGKCMVEWF